MVSENSPSFTRLSNPLPAHNGSRALVSLATSPSPSMETSPARSLAQQEQRFKELCETRLFLDAETQQQAWDLFLKCEPYMSASTGVAGNSIEDTEKLWRACTLHTIKKLSRGLTAGFTLTQLLHASNLSLVDFFNEFNHYLQHVGPLLVAEFGAGAEKRLQVKELQENFVKLTVLFSKYKKDYLELFSLELPLGAAPAFSSPPRGGTPATSPVSSSRPFRVGWLLFLVAKAELLPPFPDLVTYGNLLICVLQLLLLHMPPPLRTVAFADTARFPQRSSTGVDVLGSLCTLYQADREAVQHLMAQLAALVAHLLPPSRGPQPPSGEDALLDRAAGGYCHFPGLLEGAQLDTAVRALEKRYAEVLQSAGDVDERSFLEPLAAATLGTPSHLTPASKLRSLHDRPSKSPLHPAAPPFTFPGMPSPFRPVAASPYSSPLRAGHAPGAARAPPATPVSSAMMTATWLRSVVAPLSVEPPPSLLAVFRSCEPDPTGAILARAERVLTSIFPTSAVSGAEARGAGDALSMGSVLDKQWARVRREESSKLYWRALGNILAGEARHGRGGSAGVLLGQDLFHRCLLALCSELVLASHKSTLMAFPAVLRPARVTPFDLIKVIETLVRAEESLPRELKRHLNSIEEKILESLAWDRGSSMYSSLYLLRKSQPTPAAQAQAHEIERLQLLPRPLTLEAKAPPPPERPPEAGPQPESTAPPSEVAVPQSEVCVPEAPRPGAVPAGPDGGPAAGDQAGVGPGSQALAAEERAGSGFRRWTGGNGRGAGVGPVGSPQQSRGAGPGAIKRADNVMSMLMQKVLKLLAMRLRSLSERLGLRRGVGEAVYSLLQHALHAETHLFFLRHIDQLLLCSIYGVCKVCKVDVTFKDIIACYRKQPQFRPDTIRVVALKHTVPAPGAGTPPRPDMGDVIKLYNQVFVPRVKAALLRVAQDMDKPNDAPTADPPGGAAHSSPPRVPPTSAPAPVSPFATLPAAAFSPKKVASGIYVSPLKGHRAGQYLNATPRSSVLVLGQAEDYQSPSQALSRLSDQVNAAKPLRRLGQLNFDEGAAPSSSGGASGQRAPPPRLPAADNGREEVAAWSSGTSNDSPKRAPKRQKTEAA